VICKGIDVLNDYSAEREKSPELWFELLNAIAGNLAQAARETSTGSNAEAYTKDAIAYYQAACEYASQQNLAQLDDCFLEYCIFLCRRKSASLPDVIAKASALGVSEDTRQIAATMELCLTGSSDEALEQLSEIAETGGNAYSAYLAMADLYFQEEQLEQATESYKQALALNTDTTTQRQLAEVYMALGQKTQDSAYYENAETLYGEIATETGRMQDRLSFMVAAGCAEDFIPAAEEMEQLLSEYPEDYYVLSQTAVLYYKMGNLISARQYGARAMQYADDTQKDSALYETLEQLADIGEK
jgi:tetratricopeptide (TPR) repeat protein